MGVKVREKERDKVHGSLLHQPLADPETPGRSAKHAPIGLGAHWMLVDPVLHVGAQFNQDMGDTAATEPLI